MPSPMRSFVVGRSPASRMRRFDRGSTGLRVDSSSNRSVGRLSIARSSVGRGFSRNSFAAGTSVGKRGIGLRELGRRVRGADGLGEVSTGVESSDSRVGTSGRTSFGARSGGAAPPKGSVASVGGGDVMGCGSVAMGWFLAGRLVEDDGAASNGETSNGSASEVDRAGAVALEGGSLNGSGVVPELGVNEFAGVVKFLFRVGRAEFSKGSTLVLTGSAEVVLAVSSACCTTDGLSASAAANGSELSGSGAGEVSLCPAGRIADWERAVVVGVCLPRVGSVFESSRKSKPGLAESTANDDGTESFGNLRGTTTGAESVDSANGFVSLSGSSVLVAVLVDGLASPVGASAANSPESSPTGATIGGRSKPC